METKLPLTDIEVNAGTEVRQFRLPCTDNMHSLVSSIFENETYPCMDFLADKVDCILDIGANIGAASVFFNYAYPKAAIYAYEPARDAFDLLLRNTGSLGRVTAANVGLGASCGSTVLHLGGLGGESSSVFPNFGMDGNRTETIMLREASTEFVRWCWDAKYPVLKIDTEGSEVQILQDLGDHLERVATVYVEYHSDTDRLRIEAIMQKYGLTLFSAKQSHTHRGENLYVRQRLLDAHTTVAAYIIRSDQ